MQRNFPIQGEPAEVQELHCISAEASKSVVMQKDITRLQKNLQALCKITSYFFIILGGGKVETVKSSPDK